MSLTTAAWLVLAMPLAGTLVIALGCRVLAAAVAGWIGTLAIALAFVFALVAFFKLQDRARGRARSRPRRCGTSRTSPACDIQLGDPTSTRCRSSWRSSSPASRR